jgi:Tfp pilus assembly protein PilN
MKQHINLYSPDFLFKRHWSDFYYVSRVVLGLLVLVIGMCVTVYAFLRQEQASLIQTQAEMQALQQEVDTLAAQFEQRKQNNPYQNKIQVLETQLKQHKALFKQLTSLDNTHLSPLPLTTYLKALAAVQEPKLWLTKIDLDGNNMRFEGRVQAPKVLPEWLNKIKLQPIFAGQVFQQLSLEQTKDDTSHQFVLTATTKSQVAP